LADELKQIQLTTVGRTTGQEHEVTIYAFPDGDDLVVVGSYAGRPNDPDWAANLKANSRAIVKKGRQSVEHRAKLVDGAERERLWTMVVGAFPMYGTYQGRTDRVIPLFVLEPAD
jgi:deazaflavin-dependent oxidoreductase (nitroreductase family)